MNRPFDLDIKIIAKVISSSFQYLISKKMTKVWTEYFYLYDYIVDVIFNSAMRAQYTMDS